MDNTDKIDKIAQDLSEIKVTLVKQGASLEYHIRRTDILEEQFKPVNNHISELKGMVNGLKILAVIAAIIEALHFLWR